MDRSTALTLSFVNDFLSHFGDCQNERLQRKYTQNIQNEVASFSLIQNENEKMSSEAPASCCMQEMQEDAGVAPLVDEIENTSVLRTLEFTGNTFSPEAVEVICKSLAKRKELKYALWSDMFTGRLKTQIPPALRSLSSALLQAGAHLVELDLSDNAFGPPGVEGIQELLRNPSSHTLEILRLNNTGMGIGGGKILAESLTTCWKKSKAAGTPLKLRVFVVGRSRLENDGAIALASAFEKIETLEQITMPQNGIRHLGIAALAKAFLKNPNLRVINLNDNTFTRKGALAMAPVLRKLVHLESIDFGDCLLKTKGAIEILKALEAETHSQLKELVLCGNEIGKEAIPFILKLMNCKTLTKVDLNGNEFGQSKCELREFVVDKKLKNVLQSLSDDEGTGDEEEEEADQAESEDSGSEAGNAANDEASGSCSEEAEEPEGEFAPGPEGTEPECDQGLLSALADVSFTKGREQTGAGANTAFKGFSPPKLVSTTTTAVSNGVAVSSSGTSTTAAQREDWLSNMSFENLRSGSAADKILKAIGEEIDDSQAVSKGLVWLSGFLSKAPNPDITVYLIVTTCADALLKKHNLEDNWTSFLNQFIAEIGLIKKEGKLKQPPENVHGLLKLLQHCVQQNYFNNLRLVSLQFFLEKKLTTVFSKGQIVFKDSSDDLRVLLDTISRSLSTDSGS